jgi:CheY-like chemotaxis protein
MMRQGRNLTNRLATFISSALSILTHTLPQLFFALWDSIVWRWQQWSRKLDEARRWQTGPVERQAIYHHADSFDQEAVHPPSQAGPRTALRVALLDDNPGILDYLETMLIVDGHVSSRFLEGQSLLDKVLPSLLDEVDTFVPPYDLVILDLLLPGRLSGADVFLAIRKRFTVEQLPIIVITAVDELTLEQFRQILPDDVALLRKPFPPRRLRSLIALFAGGGDG